MIHLTRAFPILVIICGPTTAGAAGEKIDEFFPAASLSSEKRELVLKRPTKRMLRAAFASHSTSGKTNTENCKRGCGGPPQQAP